MATVWQSAPHFEVFLRHWCIAARATTDTTDVSIALMIGLAENPRLN